MKRSGYLKEFLDFWTTRKEICKVWFRLFTPQVGDRLPETLQPLERERDPAVCQASPESTGMCVRAYHPDRVSGS